MGQSFLEAPYKKWSEILEHQLIRWQFYNPTLPVRYDQFEIFPYIFTLSILLDLDGGFLTLDEFVLRLSLAKNYDEKDEVVKWIENFRLLSEADKEYARKQITLMRNYQGRLITLLFACTPALSFTDNILALSDRIRALIILGKCWPKLHYQTYTLPKWESSFGAFNKTFWPLMPRGMQAKKKSFKKYIKREESIKHKKLKQFLKDHAENIFGKGAIFIAEEYFFPSSDRINLVFRTPNKRWLTVEVEVDIPAGEIIGVLQAIKYKYMFAVQQRVKFDKVRTALVAYTIPKDIKAICVDYGVETIEVSIP